MKSPWGPEEKAIWLKEQTIKRSYQNEVVPKILALKNNFDVSEYGKLSIDPSKYNLYIIRSKNFDKNKKTVLITGGVHGYETSGVHGALLFMEKYAHNYEEKMNFICAPCVSPWGYETINRWNNLALDPNRNFKAESAAEECSLFMKAISADMKSIDVHFDLHETTDTDNSVFRPALEQRDGVKKEFSEIPDGFYVVGDSSNPQSGFQKAIIAEVEKVTHIAPADEKGNLIGAPLESVGVINYDKKKLFLCGGVTNASFVTTTEVYPDSPKVTDEICNKAQVAAITGGLNFILSHH